MAEERTLEATTTEAAPAKEEAVVETATEVDAKPEDDEKLANLINGLDDEDAEYVRKLAKKANDFDGLAAKREKPKKEERTTANPTQTEIQKEFDRRVERSVLASVVTEGDPMFIEELVPDDQFNKIIQYLPRSYDKSSERGVHRALKLAVKMWREDTGRTEKTGKKDPAAELTASVATGSGRAANTDGAKRTPGERKILKKQTGIESWYPKSE